MIRLGYMSEQDVMRREQVLFGVQAGRYSPHDKGINPIDRDGGRVDLVVVSNHSLIGLNIKCIENQAECGLVWNFEETNFGISIKVCRNETMRQGSFILVLICLLSIVCGIN